jgi:hypothetical protein
VPCAITWPIHEPRHRASASADLVARPGRMSKAPAMSAAQVVEPLEPSPVLPASA